MTTVTATISEGDAAWDAFTKIVRGEIIRTSRVNIERTPGGDIRMSQGAAEKLCAAASSRPQSAATGWKMVPVEPTLEMLRSGATAARERTQQPGLENLYAVAYRAMLAASPTPPDSPPSIDAVVKAQNELLDLITKRDPSGWVLHEIWGAGQRLRAALSQHQKATS